LATNKERIRVPLRNAAGAVKSGDRHAANDAVKKVNEIGMFERRREGRRRRREGGWRREEAGKREMGGRQEE
jgi:hypothetical protein